MMRELGYPRTISMENFRSPNFVLVADILYWLLHRYDPSTSSSNSSAINDSILNSDYYTIQTEADRVSFLKSVAQIVYSKTRIKLNIKKLYGADGYAVKELLKLASLLKQATAITNGVYSYSTSAALAPGASIPTSSPAIPSEDIIGPLLPTQVAQLFDSKATRFLVSDLTQSGAQLFDLLGNELELRVSPNTIPIQIAAILYFFSRDIYI